MANRPIEYRADRGKFLTVDEVAAWVQDVMRAGAPGGEIVKATVSIGGKLQKITTDVEVGTTMRLDKQP
jgi:hypothetical protein